MLRLRERLRRLERSPMLQRVADPVDPTTGLALQQISDEDLALLIEIAKAQEAGRPLRRESWSRSRPTRQP